MSAHVGLLTQFQRITLIVLGVVMIIILFHYNTPDLVARNYFVESMTILLTIIVGVVAYRLSNSYLYKRNAWWRFGGGDVSWADVVKVMHSDPLDHPDNSIGRWWSDVVIFTIFIGLTLFLWLNLNVSFLEKMQGLNWKESEWSSLMGVLSILVTCVTFVGVYYYVKISGVADVRSKNRQAWINNLRSEIALLLAKVNDMEINSEDIVAKRLNFKIELYLNPSDKIDRTMMALLRLVVFGKNLGLEVDAKVLKCLCDEIKKSSDDQVRNEWKSIFYELDYESALGLDNIEKIITYIVRLASVRVKFEWERVKEMI